MNKLFWNNTSNITANFKEEIWIFACSEAKEYDEGDKKNLKPSFILNFINFEEIIIGVQNVQENCIINLQYRFQPIL